MMLIMGFLGGAAVDEHFDQDDCHVYQAGGVTYSKTLNQSDLQKNNNKFYIIQLLESDDKKSNIRYFKLSSSS